MDYIIADLWQMEQYSPAFGEDRHWLRNANNLINAVTASKQYGVKDFAEGVILLQKGIPSKPEAIAAWTEYQTKIQPILTDHN